MATKWRGVFYFESSARKLTSSFFQPDGVVAADQETSAPLGEAAPACMVENRLSFLPFSGDRLYD